MARTAIAEARDLANRLCSLVDKHYQSMSSRVHAPESRAVLRLCYAPTVFSAKARISASSSQDVSIGDVDRNPSRPAAKSLAVSEFLEELKRSRVYRKKSSWQMSMVSSEHCSMEWSFLSAFSLAEVSNICVMNLGITFDDVYNPHRISQTWANNRMDSSRPPQTSISSAQSVRSPEHEMEPVPAHLS